MMRLANCLFPTRFGLAILSAVMLALALVVMAPPAAAVEIREVTSPGGITAWLVEDYSAPVITVAVAFQGGSSQDPKGREGMAELTSALFDEGAGPYDSKMFQARIAKLGIELGYRDSRDQFTGVLRTLKEDSADAFEMMRLTLTELHFDENAVDRMKNAIIAGIERKRNSPGAKAGEALRQTLFGDHPYGDPGDGTVESVSAITREELAAHFSRLFARDNLKIAIVGAMTAEEAGQMLDNVFSRLPARAQLAPVVDARVKFGDTLSVEEDIPQSQIVMAYPGVKRDDPEFFAAYIANHILGGGTFSSRLYDEIREKRGLAYSVDSNLSTYDHAAFISVSSATRNDRAGETVDLMRSEIARFAKDGPSEAELEAAKKYIIGSYAINNLDTSAKIASTLLAMQTEQLGIDYIDRREKLIGAVTIDEVRAIATKLFSVKPTLVVVGPKSS
ncbi:MAG: pitrilysin family protein [Nitratireductor sp.]